MKFQFKEQDYQTEAVDAVIQVFSGQGRADGRSSYLRDLGSGGMAQERIAEMADGPDDIGWRNAEVELSDEQLLENIRALQSQSNIKLSPALVKGLGRCSLDIEMETGTGKTYVYTKTMFELNERYGWSKFIVVVPSVAIREGVKKSLEITEDHFMKDYGKKARFFVYNSKMLNQLDDFSSDDGINVMIINTQAFATSLNEDKNVEGRKGDQAARIIYSQQDNFASRRPIDVIRANRPIIILDEPQKMGGAVTQTALKRFNPLFTLNYSATHAKQHNLIYVLDALEAFNRQLVKRIEVKGIEVKNLRGTDQYLYLEGIVLSGSKPPMARLEYEEISGGTPRRKVHLCARDDNLFKRSGMEQYRGYIIADINPVEGKVAFTNGESIAVGEVRGDVSERDMRRIQIRETIVSHFEKEEALFNQGIKTLSLFFIDEVAHYRVYGDDGQEQLGEYGAIFEAEYKNVLEEHLTREDTPYQEYLRRMCSDPHRAHCGYFSIDKKTGHSVDSALKRGMEFSDDISAYDLILRNKERLLSFDEPTRFIFSHSALREGWDNPNVFQICTLKHSNSQTAKRQEVGRGLRLCVNQGGDRMDQQLCGKAVHDINLLTVVASESYAGFVADLQRDIKKDLYDRPTKATVEYFQGKTVRKDGETATLSQRQATEIYFYLVQHGFVDVDGNVTQAYREAAADGTLPPLAGSIQGMDQGVHRLVRAIFDEGVLKQMVGDAGAPKVLENPLNDNWTAFQPMWERLNHKYAYSVKTLDSGELIRRSIERINARLFVRALKYVTTKGKQRKKLDEYALERGETFEGAESKTKTLDGSPAGQIPYDLIGKVAQGTTLTRRTAAAILSGIREERFQGFRDNPEEFIAKAIRLILEVKSGLVVESVEYRRIEGGYSEKIFQGKKNAQSFERAFKAERHIQDYVFTDGLAEKSVERTFAGQLDIADEVCAYAKLPRGFSIPTPMGSYTPDWAILFHEGKARHRFLLAETKGADEDSELRPIEQAKIRCAEKLFNETLGGEVLYCVVTCYDDALDAANRE